jgi:PAS domain S-box-containing protein
MSPIMAWNKRSSSPWLVYIVAPLLPALAALLRVALLGGLGTSSPFITFYPAVMAAALLGGLPAGLLATLLSGALASYLWIVPGGSFLISAPEDRLALAVFLVCSSLICLAIETVHRATRAGEVALLVRLAAERQQISLAVQAERNFLRQVIDAFPGCLFVKDLQGNLLLANEAMARFHGSTVAEMEGKRIYDFGVTTEELEARFTEEDREIFKSREALLSGAQLQDAGGRPHVLETSKSPLFNEDGSCDKLLVISTDITERKEAEQALRQNRELLHSIISGTPDAIYVKDTSGKYLLFNRAAEELTGKKATEVLGHNDAEIYPALHEAPVKWDRLSLAPRAVEVHEDTITDAQGRKRTLLSTKGPLYDDQGDLTGTFVIARDTSDQKQVEEEFRNLNNELDRRVAERTAQLEAAIREQESFNYSVSHDLRSPLRHINSYASILVEELGSAISPEGREHLERICRASNKMGKLIDDLLELARTSRLPLTEECIDLSRLATISSLMLQQSDKSRRVEFTIADGIQVLGDKTLLRLVIENLLNNAWKYTMQEKFARIEVGIEVNDGQEIYFVSDNGTGFEMEYKDKLFGAFQRLHGAEFEGNGIGLATVKRAIERHGGTIWAEGEVGSGATFYFTLGKEAVSYPLQLQQHHG